ncbi:MAG: hypothetical protein AAGG68_23050 [Bacteroidota bacterium]
MLSLEKILDQRYNNYLYAWHWVLDFWYEIRTYTNKSLTYRSPRFTYSFPIALLITSSNFDDESN